MYADDTIAAIATPPGHGGIGIVRISGGRAVQVAGSVFSCFRESSSWTPHRLYHGRIVDAQGDVLDEGLGVIMRAPRSYTGEDVLELHCHGSPVALRRILARVLACGARLAEPGEFTKRAFLNGRLDLVQAEAVIDLVQARTEAGAALATQQLAGRLSARLDAARAQIIRLKALLEAQIDFSEEDFEVNIDDVKHIHKKCSDTILELLNTFAHGKMMRDGIRVAIIGKPNVGKSSLLNALLGEDRAIVTPIPGTTRDAIEEAVDFEGIPVILTDTAGLRDPDQADVVERLGMQRTTDAVAGAEMLLTVLDASEPFDRDDHRVLEAAAGSPQVIVLNKVDLPMCVEDSELCHLTSGHPVVRISAKDHTGLADLRRCVAEQATASPPPESGGAVITNIRHADALAKALQCMELARESIDERRPPELVAVDVQDAIDHIGAITGLITTDDVLDRVFSEFCIGK